MAANRATHSWLWLSVGVGLVVVGMALVRPATAHAAGILYLPFVQYTTPPEPVVQVQPQTAWTVQWWQWMERLANDPLFEFGQVDCSRGQSDEVWFLAGNRNPRDTPSATRHCTIPAGQTVLAPLFTAVWVNEPGENLTVDEKRRDLDAIYSDQEPGSAGGKICDLYNLINGAAAPYTRLPSGPFVSDLDPETVQDGFWFAFQLPPGQHEIEFGGALCPFDASFGFFPLDQVNVTYHITVP